VDAVQRSGLVCAVYHDRGEESITIFLVGGVVLPPNKSMGQVRLMFGIQPRLVPHGVPQLAETFAALVYQKAATPHWEKAENSRLPVEPRLRALIGMVYAQLALKIESLPVT
jgi:hypothetical protein